MTEHDLIRQIVLDYFKGWFDGDPVRMERDNGDGRIEMKITDVSDDIASVSVRAAPYHEYIHLVRTGDGWKVANTLWRLA